MTDPLVYMLTRRPHMLAVHVQAYADLLGAEAARALNRAALKALLGLSTLCMAVVSMVLTGVAVMLWAVLPLGSMGWPWVLVVAPAMAWLLTLVLAWTTSLVRAGHALAEFKKQLDADLSLYKEMRKA